MCAWLCVCGWVCSIVEVVYGGIYHELSEGMRPHLVWPSSRVVLDAVPFVDLDSTIVHLHRDGDADVSLRRTEPSHEGLGEGLDRGGTSELGQHVGEGVGISLRHLGLVDQMNCVRLLVVTVAEYAGAVVQCGAWCCVWVLLCVSQCVTVSVCVCVTRCDKSEQHRGTGRGLRGGYARV